MKFIKEIFLGEDTDELKQSMNQYYQLYLNSLNQVIELEKIVEKRIQTEISLQEKINSLKDEIKSNIEKYNFINLENLRLKHENEALKEINESLAEESMTQLAKSKKKQNK